MLIGISLTVGPGVAQNVPSHSAVSVPTFAGSFAAGGKQYSYTIVGGKPELGGTTTIPTVLVSVSLVFDGHAGKSGTKIVIDATPAVSKVVQSPIFQKFAFDTGMTQYGDAVQRAEFYREVSSKAGTQAWHTLLGQPRIIHGLRIDIPVDKGFVLTSKRTGHSLAIVDLEFVQKELFDYVEKAGIKPGGLLIALTKNTMFYPLGDATVCCSWGAHGVHPGPSSKPAQAFVIGTYLDSGEVPRYSDIQTLTEQIAEWMNDPLQGQQPNTFPTWRKPPKNTGCGGRAEGTPYRFAEPTDDTLISNATPVTVDGTVYHLENVALLPWFSENSDPGTFHSAYSFPDTRALIGAAQPCGSRMRSGFIPTASPLTETRPPNGHQLIGYWAGHSSAGTFPLRDVSPQWDVVIVAFAPPVKGSKSFLHFEPPVGQTAERFKSEIAYLQGKGKKVLISLGGGGEIVALDTADDLHNFVRSVSKIVQEYGFDGVDLDLETPSLILKPGDTDFRKPTTPSIVNLIAAMRQLRRHFGPKFMIAEVPEGPQVPAGMQVYGGQFGSFLPVIYGTRDILSFVDVQNYNTPPLEGLDGNYYMPGTADYYVSMTELLLHGFPVGGNSKFFFPPLPPAKVAVGLLAGPSDIPTIKDSLQYLIEGNPYADTEYKLQRSTGYPDFDGAMFWNIQSDRRDNYQLSNIIGLLLHSFPSRGATIRANEK